MTQGKFKLVLILSGVILTSTSISMAAKKSDRASFKENQKQIIYQRLSIAKNSNRLALMNSGCATNYGCKCA